MCLLPSLQQECCCRVWQLLSFAGDLSVGCHRRRRNKERISEWQRVSVLCYNYNQEWTWKISNLKLSKWRISRDHIKQLTALHVNSWHHLEDRRFDFTLTFTDVVYKLELKLKFAMENETFSNYNCYCVQSNTCWADCFYAVPKE